jgi:hypothetical protein
MTNSRGFSETQGHLEALTARHAALSQRIETEQSSPSASQLMLKKLKAQKLKLKDEIEGRRKTIS